jgi:hypothetical protein
LLYDEALEALAFSARKRKTPVGAAKALHLLAPAYFPLWDQEIAKACGCNWHNSAQAATKYLGFMKQVQATIVSLERQFTTVGRPDDVAADQPLATFLSLRAGRPKTMLKLLDECFYAKYTKGWF